MLIVPELVDGAIADITGSFMESFELSADIFSDASSLWDMAKEIFSAAESGVFQFVLGMLLTLIVIIPLLFLMTALRNNMSAARVLLIVNLCLCAIGNWLCYTLIAKITDSIGAIIQPPYNNATQVAIIAAVAAAVLWVVGAVFYFSLAGKSKRLG